VKRTSARALLLSSILLLPLLLAASAFGGEGAEETPSKQKVLEVNKRDSIASARFRLKATELRDIVFRILDEEGYRVVRNTDPIPAEGTTFKGKRRLRRVEWEIIPGQEDGTSVLSIEYSRFGNRDWTEHAMKVIVDDIGKHDPPREKAGKIADAPAGDAPAIKGPDYLGSNFEKPTKEEKANDLVFPIPPLAISNEKPAPAATPVSKPAAEKAELIQEPSEDLFRGVQRGDVNETDGAERIGAYLQIFWLDAAHAPEESARKTLATQLAHALAERQLGSKETAALIELLDRGLRPANVDAEANQKLIDECKTKLKATDLDENPRSELEKTIKSILER
jgi:hypothetical protein